MRKFILKNSISKTIIFIINIAKEKDLINFQFLERDGFGNYIAYLDTERKCKIYCDVVSFIEMEK